MTHTLSAPAAVKPAAARSIPRLLLAGGITAGPLFLGALGWIQVTVFLLTGVLAIAGAAGIRQVLRGAPGGTWAPRLIGVFGASFLLAGFFAPDSGAGFPEGAPQAPAGTLSAHGAVHMAAAMTGFLALCAAFLVLARYFTAHGRRGWSLASRLVPVGVLAGFAASSASVAAFTAGGGLGLLWLTALSARLARPMPTAQR